MNVFVLFPRRCEIFGELSYRAVSEEEGKHARVGKAREMRCTNGSNCPSEENRLWQVVIKQANMVLAIKGPAKMTSADVRSKNSCTRF